MYRPGGPTTIFGSTGWGPFSDGPLNAVRKSVLSRDGVTEDNWMWMMATRVNESSEEWSKLRRESIRTAALDTVVIGGDGSSSYQPPVAEEGDAEEENQEEGSTRPRRQIFDPSGPQYGVYEPHTNLNLCKYKSRLLGCFLMIWLDRADTQPSTARWEAVPDSATKRRVLGGTKMGNGAWGLAWVDTIMELPSAEEIEQAERIRKERLVKEAEEQAAVEGTMDVTS